MKINFFGDKIIIRHKITFFGFGKKLKTTLNMECEKQQMEAEKKKKKDNSHHGNKNNYEVSSRPPCDLIITR